MRLPRRKFLHLAAGATALPALTRLAWAQSYPTRPVSIIVPFPPGGGTDFAARVVGEHMSRTLGQRFVIENYPGAGGTTGSIRAMRATPDGYTIDIGHIGTHAIAVSLYPQLAYKPDVDFAPIGLVVENPILITARKDFPATNLKEFVAYVKANAEKLNMGHAGVGSIMFSFGLLHELADEAARRAVGEMMRVGRYDGRVVVFDGVQPEPGTRSLASIVGKLHGPMRTERELRRLFDGRPTWHFQRVTYAATGLEGLWCVSRGDT